MNNEIANHNMQNLLSIWKEVTEQHYTYIEKDFYHYAYAEGSNWPNRLWFTPSFTSSNISDIKKNVFTHFPDLIIPHWNISNPEEYKILEQEGFELLFTQIAMALKLNEFIHKKNEISLTRLENTPQATQWSELFKKSFGYSIPPQILEKSCHSISYYLVNYKNEEVGTVLLHPTDKILGVHALGITKEWRRKGIAEQVMEYVINDAIKKGFEHMTLQASDMGKGLYEKLGFEEQFTIRNYKMSS